jgi:geranylgeranyl reductase family protein
MSYDVVIVGAGPAGATTAKFLAEKGADVLLTDKHTFPRDKPCGGMLTIRTLKRFPYIPQELISASSFGGSIYSSSLKHQVVVQRDERVAVFVVRKDFDDAMVRLAQKSGAKFRDGLSAVDIQRVNGKATVTFDNGESVESQLVIGADGVWSVVAKKSGLGQHYPHIARCLFQEVPVTDEHFTEKKDFHLFLKFMGVNGFGWIAPKKGLVNIGIGEIQPSSQRQTKRPLKEVYHEFIHVLKMRNLIPPTITPESMQGGALPLRPLERTFADRVLLCGDAAGQMNPLTGDGIHYAMSSGMFAANVCTMALDTGRTDAAFLSRYQTLWKQDFGAEIRLLGLVLKQVLKKDRDERYVRLLSKDPQLVDFLISKSTTLERMQDYQWTVARRFVLLYLRDFLGL